MRELQNDPISREVQQLPSSFNIIKRDDDTISNPATQKSTQVLNPQGNSKNLTFNFSTSITPKLNLNYSKFR